MSLEFNRRMHKLFPGSAAWYKLFKEMDDDGSGKITFSELLDMVRSELEFSKKDISDTVTLTLTLAPALTLTLPVTLTLTLTLTLTSHP